MSTTVGKRIAQNELEEAIRGYVEAAELDGDLPDTIEQSLADIVHDATEGKITLLSA